MLLVQLPDFPAMMTVIAGLVIFFLVATVALFGLVLYRAGAAISNSQDRLVMGNVNYEFAPRARSPK